MALASFRFQGWEIRPAERTLLVGGSPVALGSRAFDVLLVLAERGGELVTKGELLDAAWTGLIVEENNISVQIAALRKVLGPGVIKTVSGLGYRLSATSTDASDAPRTTVPAKAESHEPAHSDLFGREGDIQALLGHVDRARLVTVVGTGGVGKTAIAREAIARTRVPHETFWIDIAPIRDAQQVVPMIAKALGVELGAAGDSDALEELALALGSRQALVVLDNCEHLLEQVARCVTRIMPNAARLRWLATSQAPLHVAGEIVYRLEPLEVPPAGLTMAQALAYGSLALLRQRILESDRRFRFDDASMEDAIILCGQLDGLPLAIEMAAARVATLGLRDVRERLGQRLRLLAAPPRLANRHGTLQAIFDWSYGLLSDNEQVVFRRLEPFLGGFDSGLVQQVAGDQATGGIDGLAAIEALSSLVDKSLVQRDPLVSGRFHLLESARDYARTLLEANGELVTVRGRHSQAMARRFALVHEDADHMTDAQWTLRYAAERHNARAALAWAGQEGHADDLARLVTAVIMIDAFLCRQADILQCEVPMAVLAGAEPRLRAAAYLELSWVHYLDGDRAVGSNLAQESLQLYDSLGEPARVYRALAQVTRLYEARPGMTAAAQEAWTRLQGMSALHVPLRTQLFCGISCGLLHRPGFVHTQMQELGALASGAGFEAMAAVCAGNVVDKLMIAGRHEDAAATARAMLPLVSAQPRARAVLLHNLALALVRLGRTDEMFEPAQQAFQAMPSLAHFLIDTFALAAARDGRYTDAAVLHGCSSRRRRERHEKPDLAEAAAISETESLLAENLDESQLAELSRIGASMSAAAALTIKVFPDERRYRARGELQATAADPSS